MIILDIATKHYGAPITTADFFGSADQVASEVNDWISNETNGFIPKVIETFDQETVFAMLNALFLDAAWETVYNAIEIDFTNNDGAINTVPSFGARANLEASITDELTAIDIPYSGGEVSMLIMMPNDLQAFESSLNGGLISRIIGGCSALMSNSTSPAGIKALNLT